MILGHICMKKSTTEKDKAATQQTNYFYLLYSTYPGHSVGCICVTHSISVTHMLSHLRSY